MNSVDAATQKRKKKKTFFSGNAMNHWIILETTKRTVSIELEGPQS